MISMLIRLEGLTVELVGCWIWVTGDTRRHKDTLKAAGMRWSADKIAWYWKPSTYAAGYHKKGSLDSVRATYGSTVFTAKERDALAASNT